MLCTVSMRHEPLYRLAEQLSRVVTKDPLRLSVDQDDGLLGVAEHETVACRIQQVREVGGIEREIVTHGWHRRLMVSRPVSGV
jgi:hypothetical protein